MRRCAPASSVRPPAGVDACRVLVSYEGVGRELVRALKFRNERHFVPGVATLLAERLAIDEIDIVTWAPTSSVRKRERGFDQAEVLARALARSIGCRAVATMTRLPGQPQTGRHRRDRLAGPHFDPKHGIVRWTSGRSIALVDDVITTGATLRSAASVLRNFGAKSVIAVSVAQTPTRCLYDQGVSHSSDFRADGAH